MQKKFVNKKWGRQIKCLPFIFLSIDKKNFFCYNYISDKMKGESMADVALGNLYELNKQVMAQLPPQDEVIMNHN